MDWVVYFVYELSLVTIHKQCGIIFFTGTIIITTSKKSGTPYPSFCSFFLSGSLVARIHLIRWISEVSGVRTTAPAYNNALSYQLSYALSFRFFYCANVWKLWTVFFFYEILVLIKSKNIKCLLLFLMTRTTILIIEKVV